MKPAQKPDHGVDTTDDGWCPKCGCGNEKRGYAHLKTCPTLKPEERKPRVPVLVECPRCDETDERHIGWNRCGLCECEFYVAGKHYVERRANDEGAA